MRIVTPEDIEQVAWEGYLEPVGEVYRSAALAMVSLGEPAWWTAEALEAEMGKKWTLPASGQHYALLRFACTLHPPERGSRYTDATLTTYLRPAGSDGQVIAHALYPEHETVDQPRKLAAQLGPDFKLGPADASLGQVGIEIDLRQVYPVVTAFGLGESNPYWKFEQRRTYPLLGSQYVYAVVAAPPEASAVRLTVQLMATVDTGWVPMRFKTPEQTNARISRTVPLGAAKSAAGPVAAPVVATGGDEPDIAAVRHLLLAAFNTRTLREFCQDRPTFRPLLQRFGGSDGLAEMVGDLIDYCGERYVWTELLAEVRAANPDQWARFADRLGG